MFVKDTKVTSMMLCYFYIMFFPSLFTWTLVVTMIRHLSTCTILHACITHTHIRSPHTYTCMLASLTYCLHHSHTHAFIIRSHVYACIIHIHMPASFTYTCLHHSHTHACIIHIHMPASLTYSILHHTHRMTQVLIVFYLT